MLTDDQPRPGSTVFGAAPHLLEQRSLSVVPEHFNNGGCIIDHMIRYDIYLLDNKEEDHMMPCKNILKLVNAHSGQTALHEAVKVSQL